MKIGLPADGRGSKDGHTVVYDAQSVATTVAAQPTDGGVRALVTLDSAAAPGKFDFPVSGDVARLVQDTTDGSVFAFDAAGDPIGYFEAPWAVDANGTHVPTRFEVSGLTLTQVVDHQAGDYAYPIVADPEWNSKWAAKITDLLKACLGITIVGEFALRKLFPDVQTAARFVVRRIGWFGAIMCGGGIIRELL